MSYLSIALVLLLTALQEPTAPRQERLLDGAIELPDPEARRVSVKDLKKTHAETLGKKAITKVLDDQVVAWNKGDLEGFMAGYWKSDDLTFFSGKDVTKGWDATLERYKKRYQ